MKGLEFYLKLLIENPTQSLISGWIIIFPIYIIYKIKIGDRYYQKNNASVSKHIRVFEKYKESTKPNTNNKKGGTTL